MMVPERKRNNCIVCTEPEAAHPGYLISHDMFLVCSMKGVGRIHQHTVMDTYSNVAFAKLYTAKGSVHKSVSFPYTTQKGTDTWQSISILTQLSKPFAQART